MVESYVRRRPEGAAPQPRGRWSVWEKPLTPASRTASARAERGRERRPPPAARTLSVAPEEEEYGIEGDSFLPSGLLPLDHRCCPQAR